MGGRWLSYGIYRDLHNSIDITDEAIARNRAIFDIFEQGSVVFLSEGGDEPWELLHKDDGLLMACSDGNLENMESVSISPNDPRVAELLDRLQGEHVVMIEEIY